MLHDSSFWQEMTRLATNTEIVIDRPKGKPHPNHPDLIYPFDYGYVKNTKASDGDGIDVWFGSANSKRLTGILCVFDIVERDMEVKLLIGCNENDVQIIRNFANRMRTLYIPNPEAST